MEDWNSFEMQKMMVRTEQLLCIAEATGSRIHTRESEAEADGKVRTLVLSLKQFQSEGSRKDILKPVQVTPINPVGGKMPKTFLPVPPVNVGHSSYSNITFQVSFHSVIQTLIFWV